MKVKVEYTVSIGAEQRIALGRYIGTDAPATREQIAAFYAAYGTDAAPGVLDEALRAHYKALSDQYANLASTPEPQEEDGPDDMLTCPNWG